MPFETRTTCLGLNAGKKTLSVYGKAIPLEDALHTVSRSSRPVFLDGQNDTVGRKNRATTLPKPSLPKQCLFGAAAAHHHDVEPIEGVHHLDVLSKQMQLVCGHFTCFLELIGILQAKRCELTSTRRSKPLTIDGPTKGVVVDVSDLPRRNLCNPLRKPFHICLQSLNRFKTTAPYQNLNGTNLL
jgi:hypothetical protein